VRDTETGRRTVRHEPNLSSGGRVTETPVEEWLDRTGASPENAALRSLLERLVLLSGARGNGCGPIRLLSRPRRAAHRTELGPAAIAKKFGIAQSSVYRALA
jgi:hypothetical protein